MTSSGFSINSSGNAGSKITGDQAGLTQLRDLIDHALATGRSSLPDTGGWGFEPLVIERVEKWDPQ